MNSYYILGFIAFMICLFYFPHFRIVIFNPLKSIYYSVLDFILFFYHKTYNYYSGGEMNCYAAHFGGGKTLSIVHKVRRLYNRYNNKIVWDRSRKKFVTQKVHIISNVDFKSVPFEPLTSLSQVVNCAEVDNQIDLEQDTLTDVIVVIDEASVQLNSRSFKNNIDPSFLNTMLTSRHYHMSIYYSSQKFNLTDKLMRDVTQRVIECRKFWRLQVLYVYDATEVENASDPTIIRPLFVGGFFVTNADYAAYDTLAVVCNLKKAVDAGDMLSEREILELRGNLDNSFNARRSHKKPFKREKVVKA